MLDSADLGCPPQPLVPARQPYLHYQGSLGCRGAGAGAAPRSHPGLWGGLVSQRRGPLQGGLAALTLLGAVLGLGRTKAAAHCTESSRFAGWMLSHSSTEHSASDRPSHQGGQPWHSTNHYFLSICNPSFSIKLPTCSEEKGLSSHLWYSRPLLWLQTGILAGRNHLSVLDVLSLTPCSLFCCALITPFHGTDITACCFLP